MPLQCTNLCFFKLIFSSRKIRTIEFFKHELFWGRKTLRYKKKTGPTNIPPSRKLRLLQENRTNNAVASGKHVFIHVEMKNGQRYLVEKLKKKHRCLGPFPWNHVSRCSGCEFLKCPKNLSYGHCVESQCQRSCLAGRPSWGKSRYFENKRGRMNFGPLQHRSSVGFLDRGPKFREKGAVLSCDDFYRGSTCKHPRFCDLSTFPGNAQKNEH